MVTESGSGPALISAPECERTQRALNDAGIENPDVPRRSRNPRNTTLPVMFATNTWPNAR